MKAKESIDFLNVLAKSSNYPYKPEDSALTYACMNKQAEIAKVLIEAGAEISKNDLKFAVQNGLNDIVSLILPKVNGEIDPNLLVTACQNGYGKIAMMLLKTDINIKDVRKSALQFAVKHQELEKVIDLMISKLSPDEKQELLNENATNGIPLIIASEEGNGNIVQILINAGSDVSVTHNDGATLLHFAAQHNQLQLIDLILSKIPHDQKIDFLNTRWKSQNDETALMVSCRLGYAKFAMKLVEAGTDVTIQNSQGKTAFDYANECNEDFDLVKKTLFLQRVNESNDNPINILNLGIGNLGPFYNIETLYGKKINDIRIILNDKQNPIFVNSEILCKSSEYFKALITGNFSEAGRNEFQIKDVDLGCFEIVIKYLYSGKIHINHDNFKNLAIIGQFYLFESLNNELDQWLKIHPECENWRKYLPLSKD